MSLFQSICTSAPSGTPWTLQVIAGNSLLRRSAISDTMIVFAVLPAATTSVLPSSAPAPVANFSSAAFQLRSFAAGNQGPGTAITRYTANTARKAAISAMPASAASRRDGSNGAATEPAATAAAPVVGVADGGLSLSERDGSSGYAIASARGCASRTRPTSCRYSRGRIVFAARGRCRRAGRLPGPSR